LGLIKAAASGSISIVASEAFILSPNLRINLGGFKSYFEFNVATGVATTQSIQLVASEKLDVDVPGLLGFSLGAGFALDLYVKASAAIDVSTGFYIEFPQNAFVEVSLLTKDVVKSNLAGLLNHVLPIAVGATVDLAAGVDLQFGLRLRSLVSVQAGLSIGDLEIGAGAAVALYVELFDHSTALINTPTCAVAVKASTALAVGIAIDVNVAVGDVSTLALTPSIEIYLVNIVPVALCLPSRGVTPTLPGLGGLNSASGSDKVSGSGPSPSPGNGSGSDSGSGSGKGSSSASGSKKGSGPGSGLASRTSPVAITAGTAASSGSRVTPPANVNGGLVTSTVTESRTYTITSCYASVINCPPKYTQKIITSTVIVSTTVCPATEGPDVTTVIVSATETTCVVPTPTDADPTTVETCTPITKSIVVPADCPTPNPTVIVTGTTTFRPTTTEGKPSKPSGTGSYYPTSKLHTNPIEPTLVTDPSSYTYTIPVPSAPTRPPTAGASPIRASLLAVFLPVLALLI
jgi:hypothetical protein